ncbi:MAG: hypothetical protein EP332_03545 [Bacteroidetes bacterium]|nr:MAG: hypothetical protein EP332_03545 [Bacteroidota bacterium]
MQIPIKQFEEYVDENILSRGLAYFTKGKVEELEELSSGVFEAKIAGTETYDVRFKIKNDILLEHNCSCPYDLGILCKHEVALIFYLLQDLLHLESQPNPKKSKTPKTKTTKKKTVSEELAELLKSIPHQDLTNYVHAYSMRNSTFRREFMTSFAAQNANESVALYAKQIKAVLNSAGKRKGFIDWYQVGKVGKFAFDLMQKAETHFSSGNYQSALFIACAILDELTKAIEYSDDSRGDLGTPIRMSLELMQKFIAPEVPQSIKSQLYTYSLSAFDTKRFDGWDWHMGMLSIAAELFQNEEEAKSLIERMDKVANEDDYEYHVEEAARLKLIILFKIKPEAEIDEFIESNLKFNEIREAAISRALLKKKYTLAIALAQEGIELDKKDKPGLVQDWYRCLLNIAQQQNDKEKIVEYAKWLCLNANKGNLSCYNLLKSEIETKNWPNYRQALLHDILQKSAWQINHLPADIYIQEESWDELLKFIQDLAQNDQLTLYGLERYEPYLSTKFAKELALLYEDGIRELLQYTGRSYYKNAARYLRRIKKLGEHELAEALIAEFKTQYKMRTALLEELSKV